MTGQTGIFISHAHADQEIADVIRKKLRRFFANGVPIFLSPNTIAAGKSLAAGDREGAQVPRAARAADAQFTVPPVAVV